MTRAEKLAAGYAKPLTDAGWTVEITVTHAGPEMYPHDPGKVMLDGFTYVNVHASRRWFEETISFGWVTGDGAGGHRATTRMLAGGEVRFVTLPPVKIDGYRALRSWIGTLASTRTETADATVAR